MSALLVHEKFMCMIVYEMIDKVSIPNIKAPIAFQVCWKEPIIIGFWTFYAFTSYSFSTFFAAAKGGFWQNVGYLSAFELYELFMNFLGFLGSYELIRAHTSQKSLLQGYRWVTGTLSPRSLRPFGSNHSPRALWYMRQMRSGAWVDAKRIDPPEKRKLEDGNCSVGYRGSAMFFLLGACSGGRVVCYVYMWTDRGGSHLVGSFM